MGSMTRKEAIEMAEPWLKNPYTPPDDRRALKLLILNAKRVEEVVGTLNKEIDKLTDLEEQEGTLVAEQYMVRANLRWFYKLLTEEATIQEEFNKMREFYREEIQSRRRIMKKLKSLKRGTK